MNGYDDTSFVAGMTDTDLREIGIQTTGHRNAMMQAIRLLPDVEIEPSVPVRKSLWDWMNLLGVQLHRPCCKKAVKFQAFYLLGVQYN